MVDVDYIISLFHWDRSEKDQALGLELARDVKSINVFLQPGTLAGKPTWDNCAKVLSKKSDAELEPYLFELFEWIQDLNWPGALCIHERLQRFQRSEEFERVYNNCLTCASFTDDEVWEEYLLEVKRPVSY